jgi:hypothetical protein
MGLLINPVLMPKWQTIELFSQVLPVWQVQIHQRHKALVMRRLQQMDQLVDNDVFKGLRRLFG